MSDGAPKSIARKVLANVAVLALIGGTFALFWNYGGYDSIGAFEYVEGGPDRVLYFGFQKGKETRNDSTTALMRDAVTGEPLAEATWPADARTVGLTSEHLWVKTGRGFSLYDAVTLDERFDTAAILEHNPFLGGSLSLASVGMKELGWPRRFDPVTGRLLITSGKNTFVLRPDGNAIAAEDAEPFSATGLVTYPEDGPCSLRKPGAVRICGAPDACVTPGEPGSYGEVSLTFNGFGAEAVDEPATLVEPQLMRSGRRPRCTDRIDDAGSVLVMHKTSPQDARPSLLAMVRPDGTQAWSVPISSFGKNAELDLAVRDGDTVRVYGSVRSPTAPITGDYGLIATLDVSSGAVASSVVFRK